MQGRVEGRDEVTSPLPFPSPQLFLSADGACPSQEGGWGKVGWKVGARSPRSYFFK